MLFLKYIGHISNTEWTNKLLKNKYSWYFLQRVQAYIDQVNLHPNLILMSPNSDSNSTRIFIAIRIPLENEGKVSNDWNKMESENYTQLFGYTFGLTLVVSGESIDEIAEWQQPSYWEAIDAVNQRSVE